MACVFGTTGGTQTARFNSDLTIQAEKLELRTAALAASW
jgi:hypothetical protein